MMVCHSSNWIHRMYILKNILGSNLLISPVPENGAGRAGGRGCPRAAPIPQRLLNYPGSATQEVHMDGVWQFPSQDAALAAGVATWPPPPHQLIAQVCPMGSTALNATEIWPGSHHVVGLADIRPKLKR